MYFLTGNEGKLKEAQAIFSGIEGLDIDLVEIQEIDSQKIIEAKIKEAFKHYKGEMIVEDVSVSAESLNGLPGPLIKWFLKTIGKEGVADLVEKTGNNNAEVKCIIGYSKDGESIEYFEGIVKGKIVQPRGENGFGWDQIFQPEGYEKTFGEMTKEEKNAISMRKIALEKLREYLGEKE